jgi:hypothetical protein
LAHQAAKETAQAATAATQSRAGRLLPGLRMLHELMRQQRNRRQLYAGWEVASDAAAAGVTAKQATHCYSLAVSI